MSGEELRAALTPLALKWATHSGLCCTFDAGGVTVTPESCRCGPIERAAQDALGMFGRPGEYLADLAAPSTPEPSGHPTDVFVQQAMRFIAEHEATHGEPEQCGGECIVLGLTDDEAAPSTEPALDREAVVRAVHDWSCGESVNHGDRRRPLSGWVCERGADAILARLAESQP